MKSFTQFAVYILMAGLVIFTYCKKEDKLQAPPADLSPIARAGADQNIFLPIDYVTLFGSASSDPDNNIASYQWSKILGPDSFQIADPTLPVTQVNNLVLGLYQFELIVKDKEGQSSKDTVIVRVIVAPPQVQLSDKEIIFNHLGWQLDVPNLLVYLPTPPLPPGYSIDNIQSVSLFRHTPELGGGMVGWVAVARDGIRKNTFFYKIEGESVIVYLNYDKYPGIVDFVENKLRLTFF